ncbi:MAG: ATP-dependent helicase, partial [Candidatus Kapaibacterium sp.]
MHDRGAALVIAGAGTGKTRTLVYRLARLVEDRIPPERIVLLTFTRKASSELLQRAAQVLDGRCEKVQGGTFHSFAHGLVRRHAAELGLDAGFQILDQSDAEDAMNMVRTSLVRPAGSKRFPQKHTLHAIASASVNRCIPIQEVLEKDYPRFLDDLEVIQEVIRKYHAFKVRNNVMDYDDLLLYGSRLLSNDSEARREIFGRFDHCMVDEYQDTNALQHSMACALAGHDENIMVVVDDAQSIYSFRGASIRNILEFPSAFRSCKVITLEENYRSVKPVLDLANTVLRASTVGHAKELFTTKKTSGEMPALISAKDNRQQSAFVAQQVLEARENGVPLSAMAVLFRSGFMSFDLEIELARCNIPFVKVGGLKLMDTAHVKDLLSVLRIVANPRDTLALMRVLLLIDGVGNKTAASLVEAVSQTSAQNFASVLERTPKRAREGCSELFGCLQAMIAAGTDMESVMRAALQWYKPVAERVHDDVAKR